MKNNEEIINVDKESQTNKELENTGEFSKYLATPGGFEPPISTVTGWHVRPLHHGAIQLLGMLLESNKAGKTCQGKLLYSWK